jgi:hypothetical protein
MEVTAILASKEDVPNGPDPEFWSQRMVVDRLESGTSLHFLALKRLDGWMD